MTLYIFLLLITAAISYFLGSMSTLAIASNFVFHRNLNRLGKGNVFISNFRRIYGAGGVIKLLLTELVRDILPVLAGGLLLGIKGHADVGRVFAGFCLVMGRLFPMLYGLKGSSAALCVIVMGMFIQPSVGIASAIVAGAVILLTKQLSLGAAAAGLIMAITSLLLIDDALMTRLAFLAAAAVIIKHIPAFVRIMNGTEERLSLRDDLTYKLDSRL